MVEPGDEDAIDAPRRHRSIRLDGYDYASAGAYFLTICTAQRLCHFGSIDEGTFTYSAAGRIAASIWESIPERFPGVELDAWVIMPNHLHGILVLPDGESRVSIGEIVRVFKGACSTMIRKQGLRTFAWQLGYHDRVIRNERELDAIRRYILNNPLQWQLDRDNPDRIRVLQDKAITARELDVHRNRR